ncbi:MAG: aromatic ring-hydroxylating dioxygenase subunit alpha [Paracoccaceae bacterium]|nr:aromatic ring-hydroxylating dioxygenase subunit alpha [Paracoccaceae bacterium]
MTTPLLQLEGADVPFTTNSAESFTLPSRFYHDAEIFDRERAAIFYRNWWYAGHASRLREPGCFLTTRVHDQGVFVIRDRDGQLNGFYNVCQHRGHELVEGEGRKPVIACPYHAWTYGLDGRLLRARNTECMTRFRTADFALRPVRVDQLCGLIFVNLDADARPLAEQAPGLEAEIRHYCPRVDELGFAQRDSYDVAANWKVLIDNFLECYHCHTAHKDFVNLVDMESYRSTTCGIYSRHCSGKARTTDSTAYRFEVGDVEFGYAGWFLWPNLTIWIYPGEPNVSTLQMIPVGPDRTLEHQDWFVPGGKPTPQLLDAMAYQKDVLQPEDINLCESVQRGLKSLGYNQGRFVVDDRLSELSEHAVHHFQKLVAEALGDQA